MIKRLFLLFIAVTLTSHQLLASPEHCDQHSGENHHLENSYESSFKTQKNAPLSSQEKATHQCCKRAFISNQKITDIQQKDFSYRPLAFHYTAPVSETLFEPLIDPPIFS